MMEPKIRFKGFEGEWNDTIWGNHIVSTHTGTNLLGEVSNKGIPLLKMGNIQRGFFDLDKMEYLAANQNPPVNCIANYGDFFYNTRNTLELVGKGATWMKKDGIYAFNSNIAICKLDGIDTFFFNYLYNTLRSIKQVQARAKGTTSVAAVYMRDLKSIELALPHIPEQQAIASYFTSLDSQISASTSRLASLKQMKAASLQAMFPQEGETVPKIRFKGFEGEWKKVKLGDIAKFSKGQGYSKSDLKKTGHPIILYGRMYTKYQFAIDEVDTFANLKDASILSEGNEIIMPASGETPEDIACASAVLAKDIILGGDLNIMHFDLTKFSTPFIALVITYCKTHHDLSKCAQGKSVVHLHNGAISKAIISLPSLAEQQAIASYFTSLDRQISFQSQRLEKLKQIKSACLDKMFV